MCAEYRVLQLSDGKAVQWCVTDDFDFLLGFCQYMIDSARADGLNDFWVIWENDAGKKSKWFPGFCEVHGIRKRMFDERMASSEIERKAKAAWAKAIRTGS